MIRGVFLRKSFFVLASIFLIFFAANAFAVPPVTSTHNVDGNPVTNGQAVSTNNPFEYKIVLQNNTTEVQCLEVQEIISNQLDLVSSSLTPDVVGMGVYNDYQFHNVCIPAYGLTDLIMHFKNNSADEKKTASIFIRYETADGSCISDFELFVFNALVPAIPEFPTPLIPLAGVIGLAFIFARKK